MCFKYERGSCLTSFTKRSVDLVKLDATPFGSFECEQYTLVNQTSRSPYLALCSIDDSYRKMTDHLR